MQVLTTALRPVGRCGDGALEAMLQARGLRVHAIDLDVISDPEVYASLHRFCSSVTCMQVPTTTPRMRPDALFHNPHSTAHIPQPSSTFHSPLPHSTALFHIPQVTRVRPDALFNIPQPSHSAICFFWGRCAPWRAYLDAYPQVRPPPLTPPLHPRSPP